MNLPHYTTSNQIYYQTPKFTRYFCIAISVFLAVWLLAMAIVSRVFGLLAMLVIVPWLIWIGACQRVRVSSEGFFRSNVFNPFRDTFVPWSSIHHVSPDILYYSVCTSDGKSQHNFRITMDRVEEFMEEFRSRRIPIHPRDQKMPNFPSSPDTESHTISLLSSSPTQKLRLSSFWSCVFRAIGGFILAAGSVCLTLYVGYYVVMVGIALMVFSLVVIGAAARNTEAVFNDFIRILSDGIDFPNPPARRMFVSWSNFLFARIVEEPGHSQEQEIWFYKKGSQNCVAAFPVKSEALQPVLRELHIHGIPVLNETEAFNKE